MSLSQLNDPSMREALGVEDTPEGEPTLAYTNNGTTSTLQVGAAINTVPITSVPILSYTSPSAVQVNPLPINIIIDPPPPQSPLNDVTVAEFHWYKQDPNPALNQDKKGYFNLGDGFFKIGAEWVGFGPQSVVLEGGNIVASTSGNNNGSIGLDLLMNGDPSTPATSQGRLWVSPTGQLNCAHILPATSGGNQVLFRPTYATAISGAVSTPVGAGGQVAIPLSGLVTSSAQGGVNHFSINAGALQYNNADGGLFFATATIALDTVTAGAQIAVAHLKVNGVDVPFSAVRNTLNANQEFSIIIQAFINLNQNDTVSVILSSTDAAMTATNYPPVVGPPTIPAEPAVVLVLTRIA